jgi:zinc finger BED domain-containing protein 5/7/8/9
VKLIPLSADTIARRIQDMSDDIDRHLAEHFANNQEPIPKFCTLQIDESTDISNKAQLLAYLRMVMNGLIQNQFLFCSELKKTTTGQDVSKLLKKNIDSRGIKWENCVTVCTDGASSMLGCEKGFVAYVLKVNRNLKIVRCMIHREAFKVVNYFKSNSLQTRIFASLCEAMNFDHKKKSS